MAFDQEDLDELKQLVEQSEELDDAQKKYYNIFALKRFLNSFLTPEKAYQAILSNAKWRKEFDVENINPETDEFVRQQIEADKCVILNERDFEGRPIALIKVGNHDPQEKDIDKFMRYIVYMFEQGCKQCNEEVIDNFCIVVDLSGFSRSYFDVKTVQSLVKFKEIAFNHYPSRLGILLFINSHFIFRGFWSFIKSWLPDDTHRKISFLSNDEIENYFSPDALDV